MRRGFAFARATLAAATLALGATRSAHAFLGVADTSFVTVIANPAEAADWAAELDNLNNQLQEARGTLQTVSDLKAFAGDPRAAVAELRDLSGISGAIGALSSGSQTQADLAAAWDALGNARQLAGASALLQAAGPGATMEVFGQAQPREAALYTRLAQGAAASSQIRSQVAGEQSARASVASELASAWSQFRSATTDSEKQAILSEISQLQAQNQVMDTRRRAMMDDLALSDRQDRTAAEVRSRAADEQMLAQSALLNAATENRAVSAETQRLATLQKTPAALPSPDYGGIKLWTTADAGGPSP
jgi:hypothetical protein